MDAFVAGGCVCLTSPAEVGENHPRPGGAVTQYKPSRGLCWLLEHADGFGGVASAVLLPFLVTMPAGTLATADVIATERSDGDAAAQDAGDVVTAAMCVCIAETVTVGRPFWRLMVLPHGRPHRWCSMWATLVVSSTPQLGQCLSRSRGPPRLPR